MLCFKSVFDLVRIFDVTFADCKNLDLNGGKPHRERTCVMFCDYTDKSFNRAENNAVYHYGAVLFVVCTHIFKLKPFGKLHIELDRAALPRSAETVGKVEVELRTVECAVTFVYDIILTHFRYSLFERFRCKVPVLDIAHMVFGHCRYFNLIRQTEYGVNLVKQSYNVFDLVLHLIPSHKDMSVVLCKATDAEESVKCAGKFVTVYNAEFAHTEGKITI